MANRDRIIIGASAGGVQVLTKLIENLQADLPAAVFIVLHITARGRRIVERARTTNNFRAIAAFEKRAHHPKHTAR